MVRSTDVERLSSRTIQPSEHSDVQSERVTANTHEVTLREELWAHPTRVWFRSGGYKSLGLLEAAREDISAAEYGKSIPLVGTIVAPLVPTIGALASGYTQVQDRLRIVVREAPPKAIETMQDMDFSKPSSLAAAGIVGGAFLVWNFFAGEVLNRTIHAFPRTTEKFIETFPRVTKAAEYAIPEELLEFNKRRAEAHADGQKLENDQLRIRLRRSVKRGLSAFSLGSTIHMGVSAANDIPVNERTKINAEVSRDGALVTMTPLAGIIGEVVRRSVVSGNQERAATVLSWAENKTNWNWVAASVVAATAILNYAARRNVKESTEDAVQEN